MIQQPSSPPCNTGGKVPKRGSDNWGESMPGFRADELRHLIDSHSSKARWCDANGFPHDADQHRWFIGRCRLELDELEGRARG